MKLFNTMTMKKEEFIPMETGKVKMYACGPTVYNFFHIGNARPLIMFDVLRRYLEYRGFGVTFVQNFTDIDDRIINRAIEDGSASSEVAEKYIAEYWIDARGLGVREATIHPKATENIGVIIDMISDLIHKGFAYESGGDVYYRTLSFPEYGKLSHQPLDELMAGARVDVAEIKENPMDFALWKAAKPGEPSWDSPWGGGRPGWHIECSAMAKRYLGNTIDIHCGGQDLIFPHHENEIAQSEGCNGCQFVRYWLHNGFINVDNRKMAKSLGNFFTVREAAEAYGYENIRMFMLMSHYRSPLNYSGDLLVQSKAALERLKTARGTLSFIADKGSDGASDAGSAGSTGSIEHSGSAGNAGNGRSAESGGSAGSAGNGRSAGSGGSAGSAGNGRSAGSAESAFIDSLTHYRERFVEAMDDDFNTADAVSVIFEFARESNTIAAGPNPSKEFARAALEVFDELTGVLGLLYADAGAGGPDDASGLDSEIEALIDARQAARKEKDWAEADKIRNKLGEMGIVLEDTPQGVKWKRI